MLILSEIIKGSWPVLKGWWPVWVIIGIGLIVKAIDLYRNQPDEEYRKNYKNNTHKPTREARELGRLLQEYHWKVELEKSDRHKHIDIAIVEAKVNIEVDGWQHNLNRGQARSDLQRTFYSFEKGYITLRIPNTLVRGYRTKNETAEFIDKFLRERVKQLENNHNK